MEKLLFPEFKNHIENHQITQGAIMNIGLDNMREINAAYGIAVGDEILAIFSEIIQNNTNATNITRLESSDEFILLFDNYTMVSEGEHVFAKIQKCIARECKNKSYYFTVSAGMVLFQDIKEQTDILLTCAEYALNRAKEQGKNCLFVYDKEQFTAYTEKMKLLQELKSSVQNDFEGFELYYQPIISLESRKMKSAETLLRWKNPLYPQISPAEFIPLLEESGLMVEVGLFIIETAMKMAVRWEALEPDFALHINLSYVQFNQNNLAEQIRLCAERTGVKNHQIIFEITESGFVGKKMIVSQQISKLIDMGFQVALDDFGTGYSNFVYLKDMNFRIVKLDRVFIEEALTNRNQKELVSHIVDTVHSIGMEVCFEGIEKEEDFRILNELGPEYIQGYLFGMPMPAVSFEKMFDHFPHQEILEKIPKYKKSDASMAYIMNEMQEEEDREKKSTVQSHKLLFFFLPLLLLVLLILGVANYNLNKSILTKQLDTSMNHSLDNSLSTLDAKCKEAEGLARTIAIYVENSYQTLPLHNYEILLDKIVGSADQIAGSGIWFEHYAYQGQDVVCPYVYMHEGEHILTYYYGSEEYNYFEQDYYKRVKISRKAIITDPYYDKTMDSTIITFSYPMMNEQGEFIGVATVDLYTDDVQQIVDDLNPDSNSYASLLSQDGALICGYENIPEDMKEEMVGNKGTINYTLDGVDYVVYYNTLSNTGWKAIILVDTAGLYKSVRYMGIILIVTLLLTIVAATLIIVGFIAAIERQKRMEYEQKRSLNEMHFKALQSSYHLIMVINEKTAEITIVYESPLFKQEDIQIKDYNTYLANGTNYIFKEDQERFSLFGNLMILKEILNKKSFISQDVRMQLPGRKPEWIELTASRISQEGGNGSEQEILFMVRDIDAVKSREILAQDEKQKLIAQLQQKNNELFELGITDSLTGIYNRKGLDYYAPDILKEAEQAGKKLFLLIADVNKLKDINDRFGHLKGDEAIIEAARIISNTEYRNLIAARTGGDEFVLLGAMKDDDQLPERVMEQIRLLLTESKSDAIESGISMGFYWGKPDGDRKLAYYYDYADRAMYLDKEKGKNNNV